MQQLKLPTLRKIDPNKPKKKKILLLSDDLRMHSGIANASRDFVIGTLDQYDWVQIGGSIKHPQEGQVFDLSREIQQNNGIEDPYLKIYASSGYGNPQMLMEVIRLEKPDAILHFTDPRFWGWLYNMEQELRQHIPLMYYNIWDDLPYPFWNEPFYESCDMLMNISRQTQNIVKNVIRKHPKPDWAVQWVPHGIDETVFYPISGLHAQYSEYQGFQDAFKQKHDVDFIVFWNNRNIRRKQPGDVILSYKTFCDKLPKEKADKCMLLMNTQLSDENGTDLAAVVKAICPDYKVHITNGGVELKVLNFFYNLADVTLNIASNEGFGLSSAESLMAGTPIINNVTGGLQDQMRFEDEHGKWIEFTTDFPSNHDGTYKVHAVWAKPVFPSNRSLQGSPMTPYIFDDRVDFRDVANAIYYWHDMETHHRVEAGMVGHEWIMGDESNMSARRMAHRMKECIEDCLAKWTPRKRFTLYKNEPIRKIKNSGVIS
jgi:glycosyltransferase involved in cell wall biosynthesis